MNTLLERPTKPDALAAVNATPEVAVAAATALNGMWWTEDQASPLTKERELAKAKELAGIIAQLQVLLAGYRKTTGFLELQTNPSPKWEAGRRLGQLIKLVGASIDRLQAQEGDWGRGEGSPEVTLGRLTDVVCDLNRIHGIDGGEGVRCSGLVAFLTIPTLFGGAHADLDARPRGNNGEDD